MQRTIVLLVLSFLIAVPVVSCGGADNNTNARSQTSSASPTPTKTSNLSTSPTPAVSSSPTAEQTSPSAPCTEAKKPVITKPVEGGKVILVDAISGTTPCSGMNHYVVVIPAENAVKWVQNKPFNINTQGSFASEAQFGEGDNGIGKKFLIRILVTKDKLSPGQLNQLPADAILSEAITVTREK